MYAYVLLFESEKEFTSVAKCLPSGVIVVGQEGGLGNIPYVLEEIDIETGIKEIKVTGYEKGWHCNVYSAEPLPELEPYVIRPLPVNLLNKLSGQEPDVVVEPP